MRELFLVGARLLGIYWGFRAISGLLSGAVLWLSSFYASDPLFGVPVLLAFVPSIPLLIGSWLLLFKTVRLADWLGVDKRDPNEPPKAEDLFCAVLRIIGLYLFVTGIASLIGNSGFFFCKGIANQSTYMSSAWLVRIFAVNVMRIIFGVLMAVRAEKVLSILARSDSVDLAKIVVGVLLLLVVLVVVVKLVFATLASVYYNSSRIRRYASCGTVSRTAHEIEETNSVISGVRVSGSNSFHFFTNSPVKDTTAVKLNNRDIELYQFTAPFTSGE